MGKAFLTLLANSNWATSSILYYSKVLKLTDLGPDCNCPTCIHYIHEEAELSPHWKSYEQQIYMKQWKTVWWKWELGMLNQGKGTDRKQKRVFIDAQYIGRPVWLGCNQGGMSWLLEERTSKAGYCDEGQSLNLPVLKRDWLCHWVSLSHHPTASLSVSTKRGKRHDILYMLAADIFKKPSKNGHRSRVVAELLVQ